MKGNHSKTNEILVSAERASGLNSPLLDALGPRPAVSLVPSPPAEGPRLLPPGVDYLKARGVSDEVAVLGEVRTEETPAHGLVPSRLDLAIPVFDLDGRSVEVTPGVPFVVKRTLLVGDAPPDKDARRFIQPPGVRPRAYFPRTEGHGWRGVASNCRVDLLITEGPVKALALASHGFPDAVALGGVDGWHEKDSRDLLAELAEVTWKGRRAIVIFDSDAASNPSVRQAEVALSAKLAALGAEVKVARLPPADDGTKQGVDDLLARKGGKALGPILTAAGPAVLPVDVPMRRSLFPHRRGGEGDGAPKGTQENLGAMLDAYGIVLSSDVIRKTPHVEGPGAPQVTTGQNQAVLGRLVSLANLNELPTGRLDILADAESFRHARNPVVDWFTSRETEPAEIGSIDRLAAHAVVSPGQEDVWRPALRKWLIQCCAAADGAARTTDLRHPLCGIARPTYQYVLVLQGEQGIKKDAWFAALIPKVLSGFYTADQDFNPHNKDSVIQATSRWIFGMAEFENIFRRADIGAVRGFLSRTHDDYRTPYARAAESYARRTSFCGTANAVEILSDLTGSRRFWPVSVTALTPPPAAVAEAAWREAWQAYTKGEPWWPSDEWEAALNEHRAAFSRLPGIVQMFLRHFGPPTPERKRDSDVWRSTAEIYTIITARTAEAQEGALTSLGIWLARNDLTSTGVPDCKFLHRSQKVWHLPPPLVGEGAKY